MLNRKQLEAGGVALRAWLCSMTASGPGLRHSRVAMRWHLQGEKSPAIAQRPSELRGGICTQDALRPQCPCISGRRGASLTRCHAASAIVMYLSLIRRNWKEPHQGRPNQTVGLIKLFQPSQKGQVGLGHRMLSTIQLSLVFGTA